MNLDPRNPKLEDLAKIDSDHPAHQKLKRTVVLLKHHELYIIVTSLCAWPATYEELNKYEEYFFNEHTCPTNYLGVVLVAIGDDHDPHGVFEFVEAVWMTTEYDGSSSYLSEVFKEIS